MRFWIAVLALAAFVAHGQTAKPAAKPPAKVDQALRERVSQFYKAYVDAKFRDAEALVANDTKNLFYASSKPQYLSYEISNITYSNNFTRAAVVTVCKQLLVMPGFTDSPVPVPVSSNWKIEKGKWYWWVDQVTPVDSPFGKLPAPAVAPATAQAIPGNAQIPESPAFALGKVFADKQSLALKPGGSAEVTLTSAAAGPVHVEVQSLPAGLQVSPQKADLRAGGKLTFTVKTTAEAESSRIRFAVEPTLEIIEVKLTID
jgi:hypothetical protein